jgi:hypothetical protein
MNLDKQLPAAVGVCSLHSSLRIDPIPDAREKRPKGLLGAVGSAALIGRDLVRAKSGCHVRPLSMREVPAMEATDEVVRRAAKNAGFIARTSVWRRDSIDNHCGYMLVDPHTNTVVAGSRFELSADDVLAFCKD